MADTVFRSLLSADQRTVTLFDCKCAFIKSLGVDIPSKAICRLLEMKCGWSRLDSRVTLEQFLLLYSAVCEIEGVIKSDYAQQYNVIDRAHKGWITEDDFNNVGGTASDNCPLL